MKRYYLLLGFIALLFLGCGTKKVITSPFPERYRAKFDTVVIKHDDVLIAKKSVRQLKSQITNLLAQKAMMSEDATSDGLTITVNILRYKNRNDVARVMTGIFAGEDLIESDIKVTLFNGNPLGAANITTYNSLALQKDDGIIGSHARDIVKLIQ